jgi:dihydroorotate dehydrogenase
LLAQVVLIGAGGVASGADAYEKIKAGASLVEVWHQRALPTNALQSGLNNG